jgi:hypothetical protein
MNKYTMRHNGVARRIREAIQRYKWKNVVSDIYENKTIKLTSGETRNGIEYRSRMRQDL